MSDPNFVILYVDDAASAASFYGGLLGRPPIESSPTFVMFALDSGVMLGLWTKGGATISRTHYLSGNRADVRQASVAIALRGLIDAVESASAR